MEFITEKLDKNRHDRGSFDCGIEELNAFLKLHANQNQSKNISTTYVATLIEDKKKPKAIIGYYTLSMGQINCDQLPINIKSKLPKHPVPIARIARLAVDKSHQKKGIGGFLLHDAFTHILEVSETIGTFAVVVDAKDENAKAFYNNYGFMKFEDSGLTLFLPLATVKSAK